MKRRTIFNAKLKVGMSVLFVAIVIFHLAMSFLGLMLLSPETLIFDERTGGKTRVSLGLRSTYSCQPIGEFEKPSLDPWSKELVYTFPITEAKIAAVKKKVNYREVGFEYLLDMETLPKLSVEEFCIAQRLPLLMYDLSTDFQTEPANTHPVMTMFWEPSLSSSPLAKFYYSPLRNVLRAYSTFMAAKMNAVMHLTGCSFLVAGVVVALTISSILYGLISVWATLIPSSRNKRQTATPSATQ